MMLQYHVNDTNVPELLLRIAKAIDITPAQYELVVKRYQAVSNHLAKEGSRLEKYKPTIKPQGSFLLGTMVRPILADDELDVDLVCQLTGKKVNWVQYDLKHAVGDQIKEDETYKEMLDEEGNRCWTLLYAEASRFHMDILPAIVNTGSFVLLEKSFSDLGDEEVRELEIRITDKRHKLYRTDPNTDNWLKSNPFGYASWFKLRTAVSFQKAFSIRESIEPLPEYNDDKLPLVRVVQILKRHRDIMFGGDEYKPISIIITTLAAKAYDGEEDILEALNNVLNKMEELIEERYVYPYGMVKWISNPVNDEENFADRWPLDNKVRQERFSDWLTKARQDFGELANMDYSQAYRHLKQLLGTAPVNSAVKEMGGTDLIAENYKPIQYDETMLQVAHRQQPLWNLNLTHNVEIHGSYKQPGVKGRNTITAKTVVPKHSEIFFVASTDVPKPYEVYWQVVNTGDEARNARGLRGGIVHSRTRGKGGLNQKETSLYTGLHWIECFIVKNGVCVARSSEFIVNIE